MPIPKACVHTAISTDTAMDTDTAMMESEATTHEHERVGPTRAKKRRRRGPPRRGLGRVGAAVRRRLGLRVALLCHTPVNNLVAQQANVDCYVRARLRARTLDLATIVDTAGRLKVETLDRILHVAIRRDNAAVFAVVIRVLDMRHSTEDAGELDVGRYVLTAVRHRGVRVLCWILPRCTALALRVSCDTLLEEGDPRVEDVDQAVLNAVRRACLSVVQHSDAGLAVLSALSGCFPSLDAFCEHDAVTVFTSIGRSHLVPAFVRMTDMTFSDAQTFFQTSVEEASWPAAIALVGTDRRYRRGWTGDWFACRNSPHELRARLRSLAQSSDGGKRLWRVLVTGPAETSERGEAVDAYSTTAVLFSQMHACLAEHFVDLSDVQFLVKLACRNLSAATGDDAAKWAKEATLISLKCVAAMHIHSTRRREAARAPPDNKPPVDHCKAVIQHLLGANLLLPAGRRTIIRCAARTTYRLFSTAVRLLLFPLPTAVNWLRTFEPVMPTKVGDVVDVDMEMNGGAPLPRPRDGLNMHAPPLVMRYCRDAYASMVSTGVLPALADDPLVWSVRAPMASRVVQLPSA